MKKPTNSETRLRQSIERGEWRSVASGSSRMARKYVDASRATLRKNRRINIRINEADLEAIQQRALEEGLPYQSLVTSVLHKYATGRLGK
jgi:predicted DNA binding CopG/RHH family protein